MKLSILTLAVATVALMPISAQACGEDHAHKASAETMVKVSPATTSAVMEDKIAAPAIKAVVFYSDNCGSCKILDPRMKAAMGSINKDSVEVVKFDFSNKETIEATKKLAVEAGVGDILNEYGAKTGFVVLVDQNGEVVEKLTKKDETADIAGKLAMSIAKSAS